MAIPNPTADRDASGDTYDLDELVFHIGAALRFMPGIKLEPRGKPGACTTSR